VERNLCALLSKGHAGDGSVSPDLERVGGSNFLLEYPAGAVLFQSFMCGRYCAPVIIVRDSEVELGGSTTGASTTSSSLLSSPPLKWFSSLVSLESSRIAEKILKLSNVVSKVGDFAF
jgi:hypothetical protein